MPDRRHKKSTTTGPWAILEDFKAEAGIRKWLKVALPKADSGAADRWTAAAEAEGMTLSAWVRRALDRQAKLEARRSP